MSRMVNPKQTNLMINKIYQSGSISNIYTPLHEAKKEILRRREDPVLKKKVQEFWGQDFPLLVNYGPCVCLGRNIISPNYELRYFLGLCEEIDLRPLFIEHRTDKFVASNPDKYHLAKMYFYAGRGKNNGEKFSARKVVDLSNSEGKNINSLVTFWGEDFVSFHHRILASLFPRALDNVVDVASISKIKNRKLGQNYETYLSIFVYFGVLFENYLPHKSESEFLEVVCDAFDQATKRFGVKPLIVPLSPMEDQDDIYWWSYPESVKRVLEHMN